MCALAAGGWADPALASTASVQGDTVVWQGTDAADGTETARIYAYSPYDKASVVQITGPGVSAGAGCVAYDAGNGDVGAECPNQPNWRFDGAGGDDVLNFLSHADASTEVRLGAGADTFDSGYGSLTVYGGDGNDILRSSKFGWEGDDDHYFGEAGDDILIGGYGADELHGGAGDDVLIGDGASPDKLPDVMDGGDGVDTTIDYAPYKAEDAKTATVTLDGVANDGYPGEGDNVMTENVETYSAIDFTGDAGANTVSFSYQPTGRIEPAGPSTIRGLAGADTLSGTNRDDRFEVRDGEVDTVTCDAGLDTVVADAEDKVAADCETVERPAPAVTPRPRSSRRSSRRSHSGSGEARRRCGGRPDEGPRRGEAPEGTEEGVQGAGPGSGRHDRQGQGAAREEGRRHGQGDRRARAGPRP